MVKIVVFGDSFCNIFLTLKSFGVSIHKYKGATIRGLLNKNDNYNKILSVLENNKYDIGIFVFGFVDLNFYYYHKTYKTDNKDIFELILSYTKDYVDLIDSLPNIKKKIIINVMPSPIDNINFFKSIIIYGSLDENDIKKIEPIDYDIYTRNKRTFDFNMQLEKYAKLNNIYFCNQYQNQIDSKYNLYDVFKLPHNKYNIHINFEYMLIYLLNTCLKFLLKFYNYNLIIKKAKYNYDNYMMSKSKQYGITYDENKFDIDKIDKFINIYKN